MKVHLQYGSDGLDVNIPFSQISVLQPKFIPGLVNERDEFWKACYNPTDSPPLKDLVNPNDKISVVIPDGTRAMPSDRLLPWMFAELEHIDPKNFYVILGTGTHRPNTQEEIIQIVHLVGFMNGIWMKKRKHRSANTWLPVPLAAPNCRASKNIGIEMDMRTASATATCGVLSAEKYSGR